ncbi:MAG: hypothetical protein J5590_05650 [Clostridia bacterium]|nr:hypothetical protein [Clostridia bacterium]
MKLNFRLNDIFKGKNKNITVIYVIVIIGVLFLCIGSFTPQKSAPKSGDTANINENLEKRISDILSKISGVGDVHVMITYKSSAMKATAKNKTLETSGDISKLSEENVILGSGSSSSPFIIREDMPKIQGVVVVAEGAENAAVKKEITDAVRALTGASAANIGVFPR